MFKPEKVKKFSVVCLASDIYRVLDSLHEEELIEIRKVDVAKNDLESFDLSERERFASFQLTRVKRILNFFDAHSQKPSLKEQVKAFLAREKIKKERLPEKYSDFKKKTIAFLNELGKKVDELDNGIKSVRESSSRLLEEQKILKILKGLSIDLDLLSGYKSIVVVVGKIAPEFEDEFMALARKKNHVRLIKIIGEKEKTVLFSVEREKEGEFLRELRKLGFDRIAIPERTGKASKLLSEAKSRLEKLEIEKRRLVKKARVCAKKNRKKLLVLRELLEIEKSKGKAFSALGRTEKTVLLEAFVPSRLEGLLREKLKKATSNRYLLEEQPFEESEAPVKLSNQGYFKDYEFILKMYGLPEYNSIDPTPFIAIAFPIFFGIAFSDIGYGIILTAMALFLKFTLGKKEESWAHLSNILVHGGLATIFFGWVFGGFFGDLLGEGIKKLALLDPLGKTADGQSAAMLFIGAIALVGLVHLNLAIILGFKEELRKGNYKAALVDKLVYIFLEGGILFYALGTLWGNAMLSLAALVLLLVSLVFMVISGGPLGLMKITGFMGNTLSYLRLVALSLATFAVAMSVNIIARLMFGIPYVGFLIGAMVLVVGHFANFLFNILSSFIHPLRLHCVEFFSYFYEGTGREFKPFHVPRKYTEKAEVK